MNGEIKYELSIPSDFTERMLSVREVPYVLAVQEELVGDTLTTRMDVFRPGDFLYPHLRRLSSPGVSVGFASMLNEKHPAFFEEVKEALLSNLTAFVYDFRVRTPDNEGSSSRPPVSPEDVDNATEGSIDN